MKPLWSSIFVLYPDYRRHSESDVDLEGLMDGSVGSKKAPFLELQPVAVLGGYGIR
jgi:hypothetical protein